MTKQIFIIVIPASLGELALFAILFFLLHAVILFSFGIFSSGCLLLLKICSFIS